MDPEARFFDLEMSHQTLDKCKMQNDTENLQITRNVNEDYLMTTRILMFDGIVDPFFGYHP